MFLFCFFGNLKLTREMNMQARYGLNPDKEILEILQAASMSKQVISLQ
jgi:hypothetical protein